MVISAFFRVLNKNVADMLSQAKTLRNTKFYNLSNNGFKLDILRNWL